MSFYLLDDWLKFSMWIRNDLNIVQWQWKKVCVQLYLYRSCGNIFLLTQWVIFEFNSEDIVYRQGEGWVLSPGNEFKSVCLNSKWWKVLKFKLLCKGHGQQYFMDQNVPEITPKCMMSRCQKQNSVKPLHQRPRRIFSPGNNSQELSLRRGLICKLF